MLETKLRTSNTTAHGILMPCSHTRSVTARWRPSAFHFRPVLCTSNTTAHRILLPCSHTRTVLQHAGDQANFRSVLQWAAERDHRLRRGCSSGLVSRSQCSAESTRKGVFNPHIHIHTCTHASREEAADQGMFAGLNAALRAQEKVCPNNKHAHTHVHACAHTHTCMRAVRKLQLRAGLQKSVQL